MGYYTTEADLLESADFAAAFGWNSAPPENQHSATTECQNSAQKPFPPIPLNDHSGRTTDFPVDCLGAFGQRAAEALHQVTQAPKGLCAQSVLCAMSTCVSPWGQLQSITRQVMPLAVFLITVAQSAERKSATDSLAQKGVKVFEEVTAKVVEDMVREAAEAGSSTENIPLSEVVINDPTREGMLRVLERG